MIFRDFHHFSIQVDRAHILGSGANGAVPWVGETRGGVFFGRGGQ